MEDLLISILQSFGYRVLRQGSLTEDEPYPENFFTFWNTDSNDGSHYDNRPASYIWDFDVNFYSVDPSTTYATLNAAIDKLRRNGFVISGRGYDVPTDEPTHTGRGVNALYPEYV